MTSSINFKHLRYFWVVAEMGSIARAAEHLHLTPQSISGQLGEFEERLGVELFRPSGRKRELTEAGQSILGYAKSIFSLGDELLDVLHNHKTKKTLFFRIGIADSVSKSVAYRLIEPVFRLEEEVRLICREGRLSSLLAELAVQRLDMIIADRPMQSNLSVRGYSHLLGESALTVFGVPRFEKEFADGFPCSLNNAPFLFPGEDMAIRPKLLEWFDDAGLRPRIVAEFDDSALMKAFGQAGAGLFVAPAAIRGRIREQYKVAEIGRVEEVVEQIYAITAERRPKHPGIIAISRSAREGMFSVV
ncbi:MAG: transcriptional activator NhaR [Candidatus Accumulibacter sp.]|jgi:LysR family transcriptional activator of nhaA|nr:transcriptional activator NhaR [Accumulibacter sp.]